MQQHDRSQHYKSSSGDVDMHSGLYIDTTEVSTTEVSTDEIKIKRRAADKMLAKLLYNTTPLIHAATECTHATQNH